ncbi:hypothetical protein B0H66DRAFT_470387 [Apodospora peruviana]|uniref:2EXR domain-containing protein n=1 Tax=Apodospora peruviana TaxID=516989 RepID=A0AAE0MA20_9PEZI|nr:hypothetical protein B0H66DRAFT_470387 [Apodospora peruviana]
MARNEADLLNRLCITTDTGTKLPDDIPPAVVTVSELPIIPPPTTTTPDQFPLFGLLPAELRLKIWFQSFLPRTVELHTRRTHYADADNNGASNQMKWQSNSRNPAALSVSSEARCAALEFYTVALPLARAPPNSNRVVRERPGDLLRDSDRVLYINLEVDMVILLGDLHTGRLTRLLSWFKDQDTGEGKGLRRLAMSVAPWSHLAGAATLKAFARTLFNDFDEFVLFAYQEWMPPEYWNGGTVVLRECEHDDFYTRFIMGRGKQFRVGGGGEGWMVVGQKPMRIAEIQFVDGW